MYNPDSPLGNPPSYLRKKPMITSSQPLSSPSASSLSVGNKIYNGVSNSPHSGGGLEMGGYNARDRQAQTTRKLLIGQMKG